ncbi:MAG: toluene tolerance protein [Piscirickettsiaceae bacterium]|nr:MAG: toluene tolerance protein [Piscirickettsiaceae bacterium]
MESISKGAFQQLIDGAEVIEKDAFGIKVLDTKQGEMIKLFRRKRLLSSALFYPYAVRFVDNAKKLTQLGIPTVTINRLFWCSSIKRHIVVYQRLEGELLRDVLSDISNNVDDVFKKFAEFIATLHQKGVYFRSAHLKNILVLPDGELGLIDISDLQIKRQPLNLTLRQRNFGHILRYQEDQALMKTHFNSFITGYNTTSKLNDKDAIKIAQTIQSILA